MLRKVVTMNFELSFERFLNAWNRHQDLRSGGASVAKLNESRQVLDELRLDLRRIM